LRTRPRVLNSLPPVSVTLPVSRKNHGVAARALLALLGALMAGGCSWFAPRPQTLSETARREMALKFSAAIERAGGRDVWVKRLPGRAGSYGEILATPRAFERVSAALRSEALRENLQAQVRASRGAAGGEESDFLLSRGKQTVGRWRLREAQRILRAAIIIDDLGNDSTAARRLLALPYPLTFAILPGLPHSAFTAEAAHRGGREVMLHLPMEPLPGAFAQLGPGEISVGMSEQEVAGVVAADLASVPFARGVNNHMGSRATADAALMNEVMRVLAARRLFFIDSRTTTETRALDAARRAGVPALYRSVFLDDTESVAYSLGQLRQFRRVIEEKGVAVAIGHPHPTTLKALAEFLPTLERSDIQLVSASELVQLPAKERYTALSRASK
jgi:uncharacterized protein